MGRMYKSPPLVEALCEFRFDPGQPWDWTIPGLIYAKLGEEFPKKQQRKSYELSVHEGPQEAAQVRRELDRMRFVRKDDTALVQVGHDILSVNHLRPYPHWPAFKELIARVLDTYREVVEPKGFHRIGLRYINRIEIPEREQFEIGDYVTAIPQIPDALPQAFLRWFQTTDLPLEDINGILTLQSGDIRGEECPDQAIFLLDLDCRTVRPDEIALDEAIEWVEKAHEKIESAFEACITPKCRNIFQEVTDAERVRA